MKSILSFLLCLFIQFVHADSSALSSHFHCTASTAHKSSSQFTLIQHTLADNSQELVIAEHAENMPTQIHQVTFGRNSAKSPLPNACFFTPLALKQGGVEASFWGWHLLWSEPSGLFYARMDGEAWVSSVPKRLSKLEVSNTQFKQDNDTIMITWQQTENEITANMRAVSTDEGRSWQISAY